MRKNDLTKNTIILFIGKFCTQFISFFLLPLYTSVIDSSDYGLVDLLFTYVSLIVPIITLQIEAAVFRFLIDARENENQKKKIVSNSLLIAIISAVLFIIIYFMFFKVVDQKYIVLFPMYLIVTIFSNIVLQISRGLGNNISYSIGSVIAGAGNIILNFVFLLYFHFGVESLFLSPIISNILSILFIIINCKIYRYLKYNLISIKELKNMLKYSIPLIPNGVIWWIIGVSDKTIITFFHGTWMNGIYAIAQKFSNLITNIYGVFNMSWSENLSLHIDDKDCSEYISEIFENLITFVIIVCSMILLLVLLVFNLLIGEEYIYSYNFIPLLIIASFFNIIASFFGGIYIAKKNTGLIAKTSFYAGIINVVVNLLFTKKTGLYAACFSTIISFLVISIYRYIDSRKYVKVRINYKSILKFLIIFIVSLLIYYFKNKILALILLIFISLVFVKKYYKFIIDIVKRFTKLFNSNRRLPNVPQ